MASIFAVFGGFFGGWLDTHLGSKRAIFVSVGGTLVFGLLHDHHGAGSHLLVHPL